MKRIPPRVRVSLTLTLKCRVRVNKTVTQCPTAVHNDPTASIKLNFNINFSPGHIQIRSRVTVSSHYTREPKGVLFIWWGFYI